MKISAHTMGTPEYYLDQAIELFAELGFDGIEIIWDDDYRCGLAKKLSLDRLRMVRSKVHLHGMEIACLIPYMRQINSLDREELQKDLDDFSRCIDAAHELGCMFIRVYGGTELDSEGRALREKREGILIRSLQVLGERASQAGVTLAVETHFNTMTDTAKNAAAIVRKVDHPNVKVLYDQANLGFIGAEEYQEALQQLQGLIAMVHVKDFVFKDGVKRRFKSSSVMSVDKEERIVISRIPGEGILPWPQIIHGLRQGQFDNYLSLEYERRWHPGDLPSAGEGMKNGLEFIRSLIQSAA